MAFEEGLVVVRAVVADRGDEVGVGDEGGVGRGAPGMNY